jgi:hypothetical protein
MVYGNDENGAKRTSIISAQNVSARPSSVLAPTGGNDATGSKKNAIRCLLLFVKKVTPVISCQIQDWLRSH